tara:strand:+ start:885 stop:1535 length:651 start_codon:yes stop_codon:yes gene_type:complete
MRLLIIRTLAIGLLSCMPLFIWLGWKAQRSSETPLNISPVSGTRSPTDPVRQLNLYDAGGEWTDQDSNPVNFKQFRGKPSLVGFIYTTCVDTCSLLTLQMKEVETWMPQEWQGRVQFLSVTIDPEEDTPEVLRKYAARFEALSASWSFLTASEDTIKALTSQFSFYFRKEGSAYIHSDMLALVDKNGNLTHQFWGVYPPEKVVDALKINLAQKITN